MRYSWGFKRYVSIMKFLYARYLEIRNSNQIKEEFTKKGNSQSSAAALDGSDVWYGKKTMKFVF